MMLPGEDENMDCENVALTALRQQVDDLRQELARESVARRHEVAERVRESEERYRILFEASPLPMWLFEPLTLSFAAVNEAALWHYGYTHAEFMALKLSDLLPEEDRERLRSDLLHLGSGRIYVGPRRHLRKDRRIIWVEVFSHELTLGGRRHRLSTVRDVTQERDLEEQIRQTQKMDAVGRLAGGVAHDFNNHLTAILGYSDLLLRRVGSDSQDGAALLEIRQAGERAAALTRQLLAFSRKQVMVPEVLDLGAVVHGITGMLQRLIGDHITIDVAVPEGLGKVRADRGQIEQVLLNLAVNGRDAMPDGGTLILGLQNVLCDQAYADEHVGLVPGEYVQVTVTDSGVGMDPEVSRQIFEPFFSTKEQAKGPGLGLATVHGIVNQSGGTIWVYSERGRGTTFKIFLPRVPEPRRAVRPPSGPMRTLHGTETILLVEDEDPVRKLARHILESVGYRVLEASGAGEARTIAAAHQGPLDLLLTDVVMPGPNGSELAAGLTAERHGLRVLFMSGYADNTVVNRSILAAGHAFLQKPFAPQQLTKKVREILDQEPEVVVKA
jgi:PAS domain S-box-containing protein